MAEPRAATHRYRFDKILLGFTLILFLINFVSVSSGFDYLVAAIVNLFFFMIMLKITYKPPRSGPLAYLRWLYPLLFLVPLHYQIELTATIFFAGDAFDPIVREWDKALFGLYLHRELPEILVGPFWRELFHLFYLAYYPLIVGSFWYVWRRGYTAWGEHDQRVSPEYVRFTFIFLGTFVSFMTIFSLFPVVGPLDDRFLRFEGIGFLSQIIDTIYKYGDSAGGAFPSSHVGEAVVVVLLLKLKGRRKIALWVVVGGLAFGSIYGSFHYAIDALSGMIAGGLLYLMWSQIYFKLGPEIERDGETIA